MVVDGRSLCAARAVHLSMLTRLVLKQRFRPLGMEMVKKIAEIRKDDVLHRDRRGCRGESRSIFSDLNLAFRLMVLIPSDTRLRLFARLWIVFRSLIQILAIKSKSP